MQRGSRDITLISITFIHVEICILRDLMIQDAKACTFGVLNFPVF